MYKRAVLSVFLVGISFSGASNAETSHFQITSYAQAQSLSGITFRDGVSNGFDNSSAAPGYVYKPSNSDVVTDGGKAFSYVDLSSGVLKAYTESIYQPQALPGQRNYYANSLAGFQETIHITGPVSGVGQGIISAKIEGSIVAANGGYSTATLSINASGNTGLPGSGGYSALQMQSNECLFSGCIQGSAFNELLALPFIYSSTVRDITFTVLLRLNSFGDSSADYSHTIGLGLTLPEGVSFTSNSKVFLSAAPVPEPESYAMLLAGLGLIGATLKHRKAKQA